MNDSRYWKASLITQEIVQILICIVVTFMNIIAQVELNMKVYLEELASDIEKQFGFLIKYENC